MYLEEQADVLELISSTNFYFLSKIKLNFQLTNILIYCVDFALQRCEIHYTSTMHVSSMLINEIQSEIGPNIGILYNKEQFFLYLSHL